MGKVTVVSEQKMHVSGTHQEVCVAFVWIFISFAFQNLLKYIHLFIFGCVESLLLHMDFL